MKKCCECKKYKPTNQFHKNNACKDGLAPDCKKCRTKRYRNAYRNNPKVRARILKRQREIYPLVKKQMMARKREYYRRIITEIFNLLGNKCANCGNEDKRILQIDHIKGKGNKHRKSLDNAWWRFYRIVKKSVENRKKEYQLLCVNCNWLEGIIKGYRKSIWN